MSKDTLRRYILTTLGSALFALAFAGCFDPAGIGFGGVTGIGQLVNRWVPGIPVGAVVVTLNVPLFLLGGRLLGRQGLVASLYAMVCSSVLIDVFSALFPFPAMEKVPACVAGGVLVGAGLGLVMRQGATTGGTDLAARLVKLRFPWLSMGTVLLAVDLVVILCASAAFGSVESGIYGLVGLFLSTAVIDKLLYGLDTAKVAYIISPSHAAIAQAIAQKLERGVTVLDGQGAWSGIRQQVLLCAVKQRQIVALKALVKGIDPGAFLIVCPAQEVLGDGFRIYRENEV